ncbi:MAG: hypothetical protein GY720_11375 [bacterium]|nr:hypothetical protein [bacterium]
MTRFSRLAMPFLPALLVVVLLVGWPGGNVGGYVAFLVMLVAPGWLVWRILPDRVLDWDDPVALPALWLVLSFTLMSPAVGGLVYFGWSVFAVEWYLLLVLLGLGVAQAFVPQRRTAGPFDAATAAVLVVSAAVASWRTLIWRVGIDDDTYIGYLRAFLATDSYPVTNPFMSGDIPLAPRWRLDAWTGTTGVLSHLGNVDPELFFREILPGIMVLFVGSALFVLVKALSSNRTLSHVAGVAALVIPLITSSTRFRSIGYNKFTGLFVFLPVVAALMIYVYRGNRRWTAGLAAATFWGAMFVHPVPALWIAGLLVAFVAIDSYVARKVTWPVVGLVGAAMVPMILTAFLVSSTAEQFGVRLGDVDELSQIATPAFEVGPLTIWEPLPEGNIVGTAPDGIEELFVLGHMNGGGPRIMFLENGMPVAHWRNLFGQPGDLLVGLALLIILFGRYRDDLALWVVAATAVSVSVFLLPPVAMIVARFITPWQLWRFSWLMPAALATVWLLGVWLPRARFKAVAGAIVVFTLGLTFYAAEPRFTFPTEPSRSHERLQALIEEVAEYEGVFIDGSELRSQASVQLEGYQAVAFAGFTHMSNGFPSSRRDEAFARLRDVRFFFRENATTADRIAILEQHNVDYVIVDEARLGRFDFEALGLEHIDDIGEDLVLFRR